MSARLVLLGLALASGARCSGTTDDTAPETTPSGQVRVGLRHFDGQATIAEDLGSYEGWEAFHFTGEQGQGEDICQIRYAMASAATRSDCPDCTWAFDLVSAGASVEAESGEGCAGLGLDAAGFEDLAYSYGYAAESGAYQDVLMYQVGNYGWYPVTFASWEAPRFAYDWEMGLYYY